MTHLEIDGYHINKDNFTDKEYRSLKDSLVVVPKKNDYSTEIKSYKQYKVTDEEIIIPKFIGLEKFGFIIPKTNTFETPSIKFLGTLLDYQIPIVEKCEKHMRKHGGCQLSVPCGRGKTVMSIYIAHKFGLKTLVLVNSKELLKQWKENIKLFTGCDAGTICQNVCEHEGYAFSVGMLHSVGKRDYGDIFGAYGLVICDECHHVGSEFFSQSISRVTGLAYTLGLSATPMRKDGLTRVIGWYLGAIAHKERMKPNNQVCVKLLTYTSTDKRLFSEKNIRTREGPRANCGKMVTDIGNIESRNTVLVNIINELRKDPTRKIMILSERIAHLEILKEQVDKSILADGDGCKSFFFTGQMKKAPAPTPAAVQSAVTKTKTKTKQPKYDYLKDAKENGDIFFGTYAMAQEGLDIPRLNTLILSTPKNDIVQAIGRIMRKILKTGDIRPLIIDIIDDFSLYRNFGSTRERLYKENKYILDYYYLLNDKFISPNQYAHLSGSSHPSDSIPASMSEVFVVPLVNTVAVATTNDTDSSDSDASTPDILDMLTL